MLCFYTNSPSYNPLWHKLPDMCETCESACTENSCGHHTWRAVVPGMTDGTILWFCSKACFEMSPVPTIDDGKWK